MFDDPFAPKKSRKNTSDPFGLSGGGIFGNSEKKPARDTRRAFTQRQKNELWVQQNGKCATCHQELDPRYVEYDHGKAWADGGKTTVKNGQALCANCHKIKTHNDGLKKVESKKKQPKNDDPFGLGVGSKKRSKKDDNIFGL